jgi:hypothetical protein
MGMRFSFNFFFFSLAKICPLDFIDILRTRLKLRLKDIKILLILKKSILRKIIYFIKKLKILLKVKMPKNNKNKRQKFKNKTFI